MNYTEENQAIWKTCPEFPFIEANQFGEIRTKDHWVAYNDGRKRFVKGHILKQRPNQKGYMRIHTTVNGKQITLSVHRVVAICFVPNPLGLPQVNHKDNNPKNNAASNLEWCTNQYNQDYRKNFGTSTAEIQGKRVFSVDLKTGKILKFETQSEAARQLGVNVGGVNEVTRGKLYQTGGYWFTEDENEITEEKIQEVKDIMRLRRGVIAINTDTFEVFWFKSQCEAARQLVIHVASLNRVVQGKQNTAGRCWFCYAKENAVEKTREKFGDDMANKLEELMREIYN